MNLKNKSVSIQLLHNTKILYYKNFIILEGPKGKISYSFKHENKYMIILQKNKIVVFSITINIKCKNLLLRLCYLIKNLMFGVHFLFSKKLIFVGIGLRCWLKYNKNNKKILLIKAGYSEDICLFIPKTISVFCLRPTLLLIRGLNKEKVNQFASLIRLHRKPDNYQGRGIQYGCEIVSLKTGKKN